MPGLVLQGLAQGRQHLRVGRQAEGAGGGAAHFGVRVGAGQARQGRQGVELFEPAQHTHRFTADIGVLIAQRQQRRRGRLGIAQFAQGPERGDAHADLGMPGPRQDHPARRFALEQAEALRSGGLHRGGWIGQRLAQRLDHGFIFPGLQQARGFGTDFFGRVFGQSIDQPQQAVRFFQVGQFDQGDAAHAGIVIGQARLQGEDVVVVGYIE
ncbi:hypothetical protein D3C76_722150 [compost metagenome]